MRFHRVKCKDKYFKFVFKDPQRITKELKEKGQGQDVDAADTDVHTSPS